MARKIRVYSPKRRAVPAILLLSSFLRPPAVPTSTTPVTPGRVAVHLAPNIRRPAALSSFLWAPVVAQPAQALPKVAVHLAPNVKRPAALSSFLLPPVVAPPAQALPKVAVHLAPNVKRPAALSSFLLPPAGVPDRPGKIAVHLAANIKRSVVLSSFLAPAAVATPAATSQAPPKLLVHLAPLVRPFDRALSTSLTVVGSKPRKRAIGGWKERAGGKKPEIASPAVKRPIYVVLDPPAVEKTSAARDTIPAQTEQAHENRRRMAILLTLADL